MEIGKLVRIKPNSGNVLLIEDLDGFFGKEGTRSPGDFTKKEIGTVLGFREFPPDTQEDPKDQFWVLILANTKMGWCRNESLEVIP